MSLYEKLISYSKSDYCPMHMPGHKRNSAFSMTDPYQIDITEIDGFDDLSHAEDILLDLMNEASVLYSAKRTFLSVNGSTLGILAGISACTKRGDTILIARNSHQSVYHAAYLRGLHTEYIIPEIMESNICRGFTLENIKESVERYPHVRLVVLQSPTYEGLHADLPAISRYLHSKNKLLLVDQAHGAHLDFHPSFPGGAVKSGADLVIMSLHKTLPALTQTALIHVCTDSVDIEALAHFINLYQTSSPSYVLMASISQCLSYLKKESSADFESFSHTLEHFTTIVSSLKYIDILMLSPTLKDPSKLILSCLSAGITGRELYDILLHRFHIQPELSCAGHVLCMATIGDSEKTLSRLYHALQQIDQDLCKLDIPPLGIEQSILPVTLPEKRLSSFETDGMSKEWIPLRDSIGRISADFVSVYPPGIPCLVPGEIITESILDQLFKSYSFGYRIKGIKINQMPNLQVLKNNH